MESRGTDYTVLDYEECRNYTTIGYIEDAEILEGKSKKYHTLPEVSHKKEAKYIKLNPDGTFRELKVYVDHKPWLEIAYHKESLSHGKHILHAHDLLGIEYEDHPKARHLTEEEFEEYKKYLIGLDLGRILK